MGLTDFLPLVRVSINGAPLSGSVFSAITSVRVTDMAGFMSDTASITFANTSLLGRFTMPDPGAEIEISLGYLGKFRRMGLYVADEIEESSPPRRINVLARAKAQGETQSGYAPIQQQKTRSWAAGLTLEAIAGTMADENGLELGVTDEVASIVPGHLDQIDESDLSLLTRIAATLDLIAKPAGGLLFVGRQGGTTKASGEATPTIPLLQADVSRWAMRRSLGDAVGTVIATYRDLVGGTDIEVAVGDEPPVRRLRQRFRSEEEAKAAADAEARRAGRYVEALELEMPGDPDVVAGATILPADFSSAASGAWIVERATHSVSEDGYSTAVQALRPA